MYYYLSSSIIYIYTHRKAYIGNPTAIIIFFNIKCSHYHHHHILSLSSRRHKWADPTHTPPKKKQTISIYQQIYANDVTPQMTERQARYESPIYFSSLYWYDAHPQTQVEVEDLYRFAYLERGMLDGLFLGHAARCGRRLVGRCVTDYCAGAAASGCRWWWRNGKRLCAVKEMEINTETLCAHSAHKEQQFKQSWWMMASGRGGLKSCCFFWAGSVRLLIREMFRGGASTL